MGKPVFDQIRDAVAKKEWSKKLAESLGFLYIQNAEITESKSVALVLGAGPAGFGFVKQLIDSKSLTPNKEQSPIMVLESGEKVGYKAVYGGAFWPNDPVIFDHEPNFFDDCPFDRKVYKAKDNLHLVRKDGKQFTPPLEPGTIFRNKTAGYITPKHILYPYFWDKIEKQREEGYFKIRTGQTAEKLILNEDGKVVGVRTFTGQSYFSEVVVDATGCGATFSKNLAVRSLNNHNGDFFFGIKLVVEMSNEKINQVFGLKDNKEGCVLELSGEFSDRVAALPGIVGIYPGDGLVNISILYSPTYGYKTGLQPHDIMNEILQHPRVAAVTSGGKPVEWSACRLPELHFKYMPRWSHDGYLPVGDTLGLVDFLRKHGVNTGMKSGAVAANVVANGLKAGVTDFDLSVLQKYDESLKKSWVGKRLMNSVFKTIHHVIHMPIFYKAMVLHAGIGKKPKEKISALPAMTHSDYMALNPEPEGQPEIIIKNTNVCATCVSEACLTSDPCQAFSLNDKGIPVIDIDPVEREEIIRARKILSSFRMINAEGCLECGNCESGCPEGNVSYFAPGNHKGKHNQKNKGVTYRYN